MRELNTLEGVAFWTDVFNFRKIQLLLKDKYGFVNSASWPEEERDELGEMFDDCLVYEENDSGLYRCSFHRPVNCSNGLSKPNLEFKYWEKRLT